MMDFLALRLDCAGVGEVAEHLLEGGAIRVLEAEGAGDLAGADLAGFLADKGKHILLRGEGGFMGLGTQIDVQKCQVRVDPHGSGEAVVGRPWRVIDGMTANAPNRCPGIVRRPRSRTMTA
jgi:hypothetical protein